MSKYPPLHSGRWYAERMGRNGRSERESGETVYKPEYSKWGKSVWYAVDLDLHWRDDR